jgi:hypothetical protein
MKKRFFGLILAVFLSLLIATPAMAVWKDMSAAVYKWTGGYNTDGSPGLTRLTTGVTFKVLALNSNTAETTYVFNLRKLTALTNPITTTAFAATTGGMVQFRVTPTDTTYNTVDLIVVDTAGGYTAAVKGFDEYTHAIVIDERPNTRHHGVIWYNNGSTSEISTGIVFPNMAAIDDVRVEAITPGTSTTNISVGLLSTGSGGSATGFRSGVNVTTAGFVADTAFITAGGSIDYTPVTTYGSFLATAVTGTGAISGTHYLSGGITRLTKFLTSSGSARTLTYTSSSAESVSKGGYIHYWFTVLR